MDIYQMTAYTSDGQSVMAGKISIPASFCGDDTNTCRRLLEYLSDLGYVDYSYDDEVIIKWPNKDAFLVTDRGVLILEGQVVGYF